MQNEMIALMSCAVG